MNQGLGVWPINERRNNRFISFSRNSSWYFREVIGRPLCSQFLIHRLIYLMFYQI